MTCLASILWTRLRIHAATHVVQLGELSLYLLPSSCTGWLCAKARAILPGEYRPESSQRERGL
jgi:hypothetical protein